MKREWRREQLQLSILLEAGRQIQIDRQRQYPKTRVGQATGDKQRG